MESAYAGWPPEVVVWHPTRFEDGAAIVAAVRDRKTVLVHAGLMDRGEAQRLIDFVAGGVSAVDGQAERLEALTFLFVPSLVTVRQDCGPTDPDRSGP
jgi:FtsZ-interacting cell division protein YlmF